VKRQLFQLVILQGSPDQIVSRRLAELWSSRRQPRERFLSFPAKLANGRLRPLFRNCDCSRECQQPGKKYQDWTGVRQPAGERESALSRRDSGEAAERAKKTNQLRAFEIA
jgi:hypothetical protein